MKIMQINVWQGRLLSPLLAFIKSQSPDIIFAQEVYSYPAPLAPGSPWNYFGTHELISALGNYHTYFSPSCTFPMFGQTLGYGNAIFSKSPIAQSSTHATMGSGPIHYEDPSTFGGNARNFQHVTVHAGLTELNLINHHGHWVNQPLGDAVSAERLRLVAHYINALDGPVVFAGDLNLSPNSPAITEFLGSTGLINANADTTATSTLSQAHYMSDIICDYIMANSEVKISDSHIHNELLSDHKALITEIDC